MHASTEQRREKHMAKLIQICASENDLFGLDAEGVVYHYNFNTSTWMRLGPDNVTTEGSPPAVVGRRSQTTNPRSTEVDRTWRRSPGDQPETRRTPEPHIVGNR